MKTLPCLAGCLLCVLCPTLARAAKVISDLAPPLRRQAIVDTAERLAQHKAPEPLAVDMASPFNPADFDKAEPGPGPIIPGPVRPGPVPGPGPGPGPGPNPLPPPVVVAPPGDRQTLEMVANQIQPSGAVTIGGRPLLIIKTARLEIGTRFTATYNGQDYELELVAIDRTTFTLRYRGEEITRPIRPVK